MPLKRFCAFDLLRNPISERDLTESNCMWYGRFDDLIHAEWIWVVVSLPVFLAFMRYFDRFCGSKKGAHLKFGWQGGVAWLRA